MRLRARFALAATLVATAGAVALSSCGGVQSSESSHAATTPVSVHLSLSQTTVDVGTPLRGVAVVTNHTTRDIVVSRCSHGRWLTVGIATSRTSYLPVRGAVACAPGVRLVPGTNRFTFSIITTYRTCAHSVRRGGQLVAPSGPRCTPGGLPVLPDGYYVTRAILSGLPKGTGPANTLHVTLLPRWTVGIGTTVTASYPEITDTGDLVVGPFPTAKVAVTLRKVVDPATLGSEQRLFDPAAARRVHLVARGGRHLVSFELTIRNVGRAAVTGNVDAQVVLLGTDNSWFLNATWCSWEGRCIGPAAGGAYDLAPGMAATGDVTFAVPDGVRIGLVRFRTSTVDVDFGLVPAD